MFVALYRSEIDNAPIQRDLVWEAIVDDLLKTNATPCSPCPGKGIKAKDAPDGIAIQECRHKFGRAFSPVHIEGTRSDKNVKAISMAVFDVDDKTIEQIEEIESRLNKYEYVAYTTHNHVFPSGCRLRFVLPLSEPCPAEEWPNIRRAIVKVLGLVGMTDPSCKDRSRLYFFSSHPSDREPFNDHHQGEFLDLETLRAAVKAGFMAPLKEALFDAQSNGLMYHEVKIKGDTLDITYTITNEPVEIAALRERLAEVRRRKAISDKPEDADRYEILDRVLKGDALAPQGDRDNSVNKAATLIAFSLDASWEASRELLRPSLNAMDCDPEGIDYWLSRAEYSFSRARDRKAERDKEEAELLEHLKSIALPGPQPEPAIIDTTATDAVPAAAAAPFDWESYLLRKPDGTLKNCGENAYMILACSDATKDTIAFDEVRKSITVKGGPFAKTPIDILDVTVTDWLARHYDLKLGTIDVGARIMRAARANAFDPLSDYLTNLVWDGTPRINEFLTKYCGARTINRSGRDIENYVRKAGRKWLISAVARGLEPGCQVDTVLVLEGKQGIKKSSAFKVLGGEFFCDTQVALGDKDSKMLTCSFWIVEIAELTAMKKSDRGAHTAFFTSRVDTYRPPFGRVTVSSPRRCVFVGTTNEESYLNDTTGNRRYWPVHCDQIDIDALASDRDQLWAEAVHAYKSGEVWYFLDQEQEAAEDEANERLAESPMQDKISDWWHGLPITARPSKLTTTLVGEQALNFTVDRITRGVQTEIGIAIKKIGFKKKRGLIHDILSWYYEPSESLKTAGKSKTTYLQLVAKETENAPL